MGAGRFTELERHADVGDDECVIEVGSERGEGSTTWLADFCGTRSIVFHTIDIDREQHESAARIVSRYDTCTAHHLSGEQFLANGLKQQVRFAYLDAFDCVPAGHEGEEYIEFYRRKYLAMGLEMTNEMSAASHLEQARLLVERAAPRCAVVIDDTFLADGRWVGKGASAMPFLADEGFVVSDLGNAGLAERCV